LIPFWTWGGAEGYTAYIARQIFGVKVKTSDLSEEACMRAREIFHIDSDPADIHELPYEDNEFDVVLCSATLEHVMDYQKAISELLRVAAKAVVITLPHEDRAAIEQNVEKQLPHAHIHNFTLDSLNYLTSEGHEIIKRRISCRSLLFLDSLVEAYPRHSNVGRANNPRLFIGISLASAWRKIYGKKVASLMISLDTFLCNFLSYYLMLFVVLKDKECYYPRERRRISASQIVNFAVPYHYLNKK
jgi:SAM-dependent methyltransferase